MGIITKIVAILVALLSMFGIGNSGCGGNTDDGSEWQAMVKENYEEFLSEIDGDNDKIPMIVMSDIHGSIGADSNVYSYINSIVDWSKISRIINLGDTTTTVCDLFELEGYRIAASCLPTEKRLEICGNHDGHLLLAPVDLSNYLVAYGAEGLEYNSAFTVKDDDFNVRYVVLDPMSYPWTYTNGKLTTEQADFLIKEFEKTDDSDIVFLAHTYLFRDNLVDRYGENFSASEYFIGGETDGADVKASFVNMLSARKNKTSGVLIDSEGVQHKYDFTDCKGEFLMTLHGHHHTEGWQTEQGITEFLFQGFKNDNNGDNEPDCFYFAYIDRSNNTFKFWKNVIGYEAFEISF